MGDPITLGVMAVSVASAGLTAAGQGEAAKGTAAADAQKAAELQQASEYGELKAVQTNAQMTRNLSNALGNIDAVRAAARTDPTSPTGGAIREYTEETGDIQKSIAIGNITEQNNVDTANAAYLRSASSDALLGGDLSIAGTLLKGASGALGGVGKVPGAMTG